mmetsp:Transcript_28998/g.35298  ORF Transcript_28998/g.35298 Transcript_28998/m.35298 type:complete len:207 (-) Transcript_28998:30-650(-)
MPRPLPCHTFGSVTHERCADRKNSRAILLPCYSHCRRRRLLRNLSCRRYMSAIRSAGEYTGYLVDLMGGQVLATLTELALGFGKLRGGRWSVRGDVFVDEGGLGVIRQYSVTFPVDLKQYVEDIYRYINEAGKIMMGGSNNISHVGVCGDGDSINYSKYHNVMFEEVVAEARSAFRHNVEVYSEESIVIDSIIGLKNIVTGWMSLP